MVFVIWVFVVDFEQLLVGLVTAFRYVGDEINPKLAQTEAEILHEAVKEKKGSYEEAIRVLTTRSKTQLVATFNRYREIHGTSISKVQQKETPHPFISFPRSDHQNYYRSSIYVQLKREIELWMFYLSYNMIWYFDLFYFCRNWWMKDLMSFRGHCTLPFVPPVIILSTMKRFEFTLSHITKHHPINPIIFWSLKFGLH